MKKSEKNILLGYIIHGAETRSGSLALNANDEGTETTTGNGREMAGK